MLASVLTSDRAIQINIQIVRVFAKMRELLLTHKDILVKIEQIHRKLAEHDNNILLIFEYIKRLEEDKVQESNQKGRKQIGFKQSEK